MTLALTDIPAAVEDYLRDSVTIDLGPVTPKDPAQDILTPGQAATTRLTVTNGDSATGIRLTNVLYHVTVNDPTVLPLLAPGQLIVFAFADRDKTKPIAHDTQVGDMYVENSIETSLDAGQTSTALNLSLQCLKQGDVTVTVRVVADIDTDDLFRTAHSKGRQRTAEVQ